MRAGWRLGDGRIECGGCRRADLGDGGHDLRQDPHAADGVVHCLLAVRHGQGRDLGAAPAAVAGDRLLPDGVGDAAPAAVGAGAAGPGPAGRDGGGGRDVHRRGGAGAARRPAATARRCSPASRSRSASRRGSAGAGWPCWPTRPRASLHPFVSRQRRAGQHGHHRRLDRLQRRWPAWATPTSGAARRPPAPAARTPASCCPPCTGSPRWQAVAAGHPPGLGGRGAPARLPERVRLPVQPPPLAQPRHGLLPGAGTRRRARPGPLPRPARHQPPRQDRPRQQPGETRQAWTGPQRPGPGAKPRRSGPVRWIPLSAVCERLRSEGIDVVRVSYPDLIGVDRGRDVLLDELAARVGARPGVLPRRLPHLPDGRRGPGAGRPRAGLPDITRPPRPDTLTDAAVGAGRGLVPRRRDRPGGAPAQESPRDVVRRVAERLAELGLQPVCRSGAGVLPAGAGRRHAGWRRYADAPGNVYVVGRKGDPQGLLLHMLRQLRDAGLRRDRGQPRVLAAASSRSTSTTPTLVDAADRAFRLKSAVQEIARHAACWPRSWPSRSTTRAAPASTCTSR